MYVRDLGLDRIIARTYDGYTVIRCYGCMYMLIHTLFFARLDLLILLINLLANLRTDDISG